MKQKRFIQVILFVIDNKKQKKEKTQKEYLRYYPKIIFIHLIKLMLLLMYRTSEGRR